MRPSQSPIPGHYNLKKPIFNKFFLCLRPVVLGDFLADPKVGNTSSPAFKLIAMGRKGGALSPHVFQSPEADVAGNSPRKKKSKKNFLRVIKAVLFDTSLARNIKKRTSPKKTKHSNGEAISKVDMDLNLVKEKLLRQKHSKKFHARDVAVPFVNSSTVSSSASSINNSKRFAEKELSSRPTNQTVEIKTEMIMQENQKGHHDGSNKELVLLLLTITVVVLWGKVLAILCTLTWLFFMPNWGTISGKKSLKHSRAFSQSMDMEEYKKKIIMEGFLDRNRNRLP